MSGQYGDSDSEAKGITKLLWAGGTAIALVVAAVFGAIWYWSS